MKNPRVASDANVALITMYKALQNGWIPPHDMSEDEYERVKNTRDDNDPLTAFAGFGCSFAGKWFGGLASSEVRNYVSNAKNSVMYKAGRIVGVKFCSGDYRDYRPHGELVYCDPPYSGMTGYDAVGYFDSDEFWNVMRQWSINNTVVVSEYSAPQDFVCVKEMLVKTDMCVGGKKDHRIERLFMLSGTETHDVEQMSLFG